MAGGSRVGGGVIKKIFRSRLPERLAGRLPPLPVELAVGISVAVALTAARIPMEPLLGQQAPFAFVYPSVVIACVLAGWRSGLSALVVGQLLTLYAVVEPRWTFAVYDPQGVGGLLFATASQLLIVAVIALYQREVTTSLANQERQMDLLNEALREIDHRTKNNYQTVLALILLQAQRAEQPEVKRALNEAADRVKAVSLASEKLALRSEGLGTVRLGDHLCELCSQIMRGLTRDGVQIHCDVANLSASPEKAIYLSIIVNELVTNALKHAFRNGSEGVVRVSSSVVAEGIAFVVEDNGCGVATTRSSARTGLGTRLVDRFVKQIGAKHQVSSSDKGTVHKIVVPSLD